jgi:hypothetical protein
MILSAVINSNVNGNTFTQATLGNSSGGTFIVGELPETDPRAANWALQNDAGVYYSSIPVVANAQTCLVAQIDFSVNGGNDRMRVWLNPPNPLPLALPADIDVTTAHVAEFSGVFWQTQQGQVIDEIGVNYGGGTWTKITQPFIGCETSQALLLTDGGVLVQDFCNPANFYKFTPDIYGSYINGTWKQVASIPAAFQYAPIFYPAAVLKDGRVIFAGGEYNFAGSSGNVVAIYDPFADSWTSLAPPDFLVAQGVASQGCDIKGNRGTGATYKYWCGIGESPNGVLPDGSFMVGDSGYEFPPPGPCPAPCVGKLEALLPPPYTGPWIQTGLSKHDGNTEQQFTLLPSPQGTSLTLGLVVDTYHGFGYYGTAPTPICTGSSLAGNGASGWQSSELYVKGNYFGAFPGDWYCLGDTVEPLWQGNEMGPAVLRSDGTVFQGGADQYTAILGADFKWKAGPGYPIDSSGNQLTMSDAPGALLRNGNVLISTSPGRDTTNPSVFFELTPDPSNVLVQVPAVSYASTMGGSGYVQFLELPTGQIWATSNRSGYGIEIYTPNNPNYNNAWAPALSATCFLCRVHTTKPNKWFGQRFNGMSQGASYGDEFQSASNYPLVRITDHVNGRVYYCRTYNFSSMGVATGNLSVSTDFDCSKAKVPLGTIGTLEVVANGIPSNRQLVFVVP